MQRSQMHIYSCMIDRCMACPFCFIFIIYASMIPTRLVYVLLSAAAITCYYYCMLHAVYKLSCIAVVETYTSSSSKQARYPKLLASCSSIQMCLRVQHISCAHCTVIITTLQFFRHARYDLVSMKLHALAAASYLGNEPICLKKMYIDRENSTVRSMHIYSNIY